MSRPSRGCPYKCEYCLSSLDKSVRNFQTDLFLGEMQRLIERGCRQFKFVDRTFNLSPTISTQILKFFLNHKEKNLFLHFEMVPDRLPDELKNLIEQFPPGSLQFEIGIQTWNPKVAANVSRRQNYLEIEKNLKYLKEKTHVHSHADLIVGLPGESIQSFANGFNQLLELNPDEIQVGILKRLKGTPITRHDQEFQMVYSDLPPFQILSTKDIHFHEMQSMVRFAKFWDLYANSGQFLGFIQYLRQKAAETNQSFFDFFFEFSEFLHQRHPISHGIGIHGLFLSAYLYLTEKLQIPEVETKELLLKDYARAGRRDLPHFMKLGEAKIKIEPAHSKNKRQVRHQTEPQN